MTDVLLTEAAGYSGREHLRTKSFMNSAPGDLFRCRTRQSIIAAVVPVSLDALASHCAISRSRRERCGERRAHFNGAGRAGVVCVCANQCGGGAVARRY